MSAILGKDSMNAFAIYGNSKIFQNNWVILLFYSRLNFIMHHQHKHYLSLLLYQDDNHMAAVCVLLYWLFQNSCFYLDTHPVSLVDCSTPHVEELPVQGLYCHVRAVCRQEKDLKCRLTETKGELKYSFNAGRQTENCSELEHKMNPLGTLAGRQVITLFWMFNVSTQNLKNTIKHFGITCGLI